MAYLSVPKIFRHLTFLHLSSPFIVDNCSHISNLSFAITYKINSLASCCRSTQKPLSCPIPAAFPCIGAPDASLLLPVISLLDGHLLAKVLHGTKLPCAIIIATSP